MTVRALVAMALSALAFCAGAADAPLDPRRSVADFDAVWKAIDRDYAFHDARHAAWKRARDTWRPRARVSSRAELESTLEGLLATLHDENVALVERPADSWRSVPEEADIWARWRGDAATIESVRIFGDADVAGLKPGDIVVSVEGVPVARAVDERLRGMDRTASARDWALRQLLAGPRAGEMRLEVSSNGKRRRAVVERRAPGNGSFPVVVARRVGDARDVGYLRIKTALTDARVLPEFDAGLDALAGTRGLIVDLREVSGRATSQDATAAILGRFASAPVSWQLRERPGRPREADKVSPRGTPYTAPVVVLVDRWTAGEGEALAAGLHAVAKARLVGTAMAGLRGTLVEFAAPNSGIAVRFPAHRALSPEGAPRERLAPAIAVDLALPQVGSGDPILYQGLKLFE